MGIHTSAARVGAIITPLVAQASETEFVSRLCGGVLDSLPANEKINTLQVLFDINDYLTISLYAGSSLVLIAFSLLLPIETKGRSLKVKLTHCHSVSSHH